MDLLPRIFSPFFSERKDSGYAAEYGRFKKAIRKNPADHGLKAQLVKSCLRNHFAGAEVPEDHLTDAVDQFQKAADGGFFDLEIHYLMGRYHMDRGDEQAHRVLLDGIKRFNEYVVTNPSLKPDYVDLAYAIALNLLTLQSGTVDPELDRFFKTIRKSFPLHVKRIELENEMEKPSPDPDVLTRLTREIAELRISRDQDRPKVPVGD